MGIEVTFAQIDPTASQSADDLMYRKTSVRSTSPVPIVSMKPTASISYKTEVQPIVTVKPTASISYKLEPQAQVFVAKKPTASISYDTTAQREQDPVRTLTTSVPSAQTQPDPAAGGAEGGPTLRPAGSGLPSQTARPASSSAPSAAPSAQATAPTEQDLPKKRSALPWIVGGVGGAIVLGFLFRRRGR